MGTIRSKYFRVFAITIADTVKTLFEAPTIEEAERFALAYDGGEPEVFIKPVYVLNQSVRKQGQEF